MSESSPTELMVAVGTDHHPFDRLVTWVDEWAASRAELSVIVQRGTSITPRHCPSVEVMPHPELCERFARSTVVISHGGPSTVMDARMAGRLPIVVARNPAFGEHVDDHQQRFAQHLRRHGLARIADDRDQLFRLLEEATEFPDRFSVTQDHANVGGVVQFGRQLDQLLGISTPLVPASPAEVSETMERASNQPGPEGV